MSCLSSNHQLANVKVSFTRKKCTPCYSQGLHSSRNLRVRSIPVSISIKHQLLYGQHLRLTGGATNLGNWNPQKGLILHWNEGHLWKGQCDLDAESAIECKLVVGTEAGNPKDVSKSVSKSTSPDDASSSNFSFAWQPGSNRRISIPKGAPAVDVVFQWVDPTVSMSLKSDVSSNKNFIEKPIDSKNDDILIKDSGISSSPPIHDTIEKMHNKLAKAEATPSNVIAEPKVIPPVKLVSPPFETTPDPITSPPSPERTTITVPSNASSPVTPPMPASPPPHKPAPASLSASLASPQPLLKSSSCHPCLSPSSSSSAAPAPPPTSSSYHSKSAAYSKPPHQQSDEHLRKSVEIPGFFALVSAPPPPPSLASLGPSKCKSQSSSPFPSSSPSSSSILSSNPAVVEAVNTRRDSAGDSTSGRRNMGDIEMNHLDTGRTNPTSDDLNHTDVKNGDSYSSYNYNHDHNNSNNITVHHHPPSSTSSTSTLSAPSPSSSSKGRRIDAAMDADVFTYHREDTAPGLAGRKLAVGGGGSTTNTNGVDSYPTL
eukprot:CAMPEP_0175064554 /NCGR_PEP_ID=MMETSP0052_2-20121109/15401_1 /TAXON_ID=51329 ORGANISM="Polytomella parva, Strain SAG 63-3" /NCGR_SAMPLE_ID=MMETSP0052_2 /ASSEMBLY_ACC=CAM_ASM_000194 /LENGTH=541 /DNA_ID=CAMNT_0016330925 /DNA_START=131 /DNA_END=1753 /DNA_ORIENTATION=-